jgi:hypothetical protein
MDCARLPYALRAGTGLTALSLPGAALRACFGAPPVHTGVYAARRAQGNLCHRLACYKDYF